MQFLPRDLTPASYTNLMTERDHLKPISQSYLNSTDPRKLRDIEMMKQAIQNGKLGLVQQIFDYNKTNPHFHYDDAIFSAIETGDTKILSFIINHIYKLFYFLNKELTNTPASVTSYIIKLKKDKYSSEQIAKVIKSALVFNDSALLNVLLNEPSLATWYQDTSSTILELLSRTCSVSQMTVILRDHKKQIYMRYIFNMRLSAEQELEMFKVFLQKNLMIHEEDISLMIRTKRILMLDYLLKNVDASLDYLMYYRENKKIWFDLKCHFVLDAIGMNNYEILDIILSCFERTCLNVKWINDYCVYINRENINDARIIALLYNHHFPIKRMRQEYVDMLNKMKKCQKDKLTELVWDLIPSKDVNGIISDYTGIFPSSQILDNSETLQFHTC